MKKFFGFIFGTLVLSCLLAGAALWVVNRKVAAGADTFLRKYVFTQPQTANFAKVSIDLLTGKFALAGLTMTGRDASSMSWTLAARDVNARLPIQNLLAGEASIDLLNIQDPEIGLDIDPEETGGMGVPSAPRWLDKLPIQAVHISNGTLRVRIKGLKDAFELGSMEGRLSHGGNGEPVQIQMDGKILSEPPGAFSIHTDISRSAPKHNFEGEVRLKTFSMPYAATRLFPSDPGIQLQEGFLNLKTQFTCKEDWLTASHLVEISSLKIHVSDDTKSIAGLPVKRLKDILNIDYVSFVVPMNGSVRDPYIGITSSVQQIMLKILEGKIEDKEELNRFAQKAGIYIGNKIDAAIKAWLDKKGR